MYMRVLRGQVLDGHEPDFVELSRRQASAGARARGMIAFMAGYRRVEHAECFVLVSTWESERAARRRGYTGSGRAARSLAAAIRVERVDTYELIPPAFAGVLDAPGAVIRLSEAWLRPGRREALLSWLRAKNRELHGQHWLMAWAMGEHAGPDGAHRLACASGWASPLLIEQFGDPGRTPGAALFADLDEFVTDFRAERYQAIELALPDTLTGAGARRVIAARFHSEDAAQAARGYLAQSVASASENSISIARMGGVDDGTEPRILVARVTVGDYGYAERVIADHGGQVVLAHDELSSDELISDEPSAPPDARSVPGDGPSLPGPQSLATT
jgi:heme-degrading monooxygenase HmoA